MSRDDVLDRRIVWTNRVMWVLLAAILGTAVWTLASVNIGQRDEMSALGEQNALLREQNGALSDLVERQRITDAERDSRLQGAVNDVEALLIDYFAAHDENVALKLNETLHRIAALLGRPAGTPPNPVNAVGPMPHSTPSSEPSTAPRSVPPPAPTTTTPDQRSCVKRPGGPRC